MRVARNNSQYMRSPSCHHLVWIAFIKLSTLLIPDTVLIHLLGLTTIERRSAWREKIALFLSYLLITVLFYFWLEYITTLFCDPPKTYYFGDVYTNNSILTSINGDVLKMGEYGNATEMTAYINAYPAMDLSPMFPRFMLLHRTGGGSYSHDTIDHCINHFNYSRQADNWLEYKLSTDAGYLFENNMLVSCPIPGKRNVTGAPCFYSTSHLNEYKGYPKKGSVRYNSIDIYNNFTVLPYRGTPGNAYVILDGKVLDVTDYLQAATRVVKVAKGTYSRALHLDRMFLPLELTIMLFINTGMDITDKFYAEIDHAADYKECLMTLFYHGVVTGGIEEGCSQINLALWITLGCFLLYFILKLNLANLSRLHFIQQLLHKSSFQSLYLPSINTELLPYTLLLIPCYAEAADIIKQTFDSLARNNYPDNRKLLCFVCDGVVKSKSSSKENYLCILEALGYSSSKEPEIKSYVSLGQGSRKINYAKVYAGFYESGRNRVPFVMVVKIGSPREEMFVKGGRAPGNRGKRDSIVIIMSFLERCTDLLHKRMTPLEFELFNQCYNVLGIDPRALKYMLITDGDTQVQADVIHKLIFRLESDPYILAINGHIRPANPEENIMTMLQIFPNYLYYYTSFAYEACLGTVTSINGGFVMYRLWKDMAKSNSSSITASSQRYTINNFSNQRYISQNLPKRSKVNDEIVPESSLKSTESVPNYSQEPLENNMVPIDISDDDSSSNDSIISDTSNSISIAINRKKSRMTDKTQQLPMKNFFNYHDIIPICIHPTVLRGLAAVKPNSLHQETVLLQGEDQYLSVVLLQSHPKHKLAFESETIAYSTLPTNFFALQGLQVRNIRSTFHNHIEVLRIARHLGFMYWIITLIKIIDMIFCMPITAYLYTVYIRYFLYQDLAFGIVAGSFSILVVMHVFYFACRRQFKYLVWFLVYVVISLPLYNLYFPILAAWCSNDSHLWYDVWPTQEGGYRNRLHGIIDEVEAEDRSEKQLEEEAEEAISRMRLRDFEISEAQKNAQREREEADMLDAKFTGFPGYVSSHNAEEDKYLHGNKQSWSPIPWTGVTEIQMISSPPIAQTRDAYNTIKLRNNRSTNTLNSSYHQHPRFGSDEDMKLFTPSLKKMTPYIHDKSILPSTDSSIHSGRSSPFNPFFFALDDPFHDSYEDIKTINHKPSHSQSSFVSYSSRESLNEYPLFRSHSVPFQNDDCDSHGSIYHLPVSSPLENSIPFRSYSHTLYNNTNHDRNYIHNLTLKGDSHSIASISHSVSNSVLSLEETFTHLGESSGGVDPHFIPGNNRRRQPSIYLTDEMPEGRSTPNHSRLKRHLKH